MSRRYSDLKFLRYPAPMEAIRRREVVAPVHVRIKPNNHCSHGCWFCAYRADQLQLGEDMDLKGRLSDDKVLEIVDDLVAIVIGVGSTDGLQTGPHAGN